MKRFFFAACGLLCVRMLFAAEVLTSPEGKLTLTFDVADGVPRYELAYKGRQVVRPSRMGLQLKDAPSFTEGFVQAAAERSAFDETWEPVWGETKTIRNRYNELAVTLVQDGRTMIVRFRLYDDGLGFRYEFPEQPQLTYFVVAE